VDELTIGQLENLVPGTAPATVKRVASYIRLAESNIWDEYVSPNSESLNDDPWPTGYRWLAVYVVTGGSEGFYLHVDAIFDDAGAWIRKPLVVGKTCSATSEKWDACWASAARIARFLEA